LLKKNIKICFLKLFFTLAYKNDSKTQKKIKKKSLVFLKSVVRLRKETGSKKINLPWENIVTPNLFVLFTGIVQ
jgi:hypothetical protein